MPIQTDHKEGFGEILRQARVRIPMTLHELATKSGISPSHLGRIERGERFPSASMLRKMSQPLGFEEDELFTLAGYLSTKPESTSDNLYSYSGNKLDPFVSKMLAQEPAEIQRAVIGILSVLKSLSKTMT